MPTEPLLLSWGDTNPLPRLALRPSVRMQRRATADAPARLDTGPRDQPFDFSRAMRELCADIVAKCPELAHIDVSRLLFSIIKARNGFHHGLQARITPMRFQGGSLTTKRRSTTFQVQRFQVDQRDMLYLVTFCLPRFQNRALSSKFVTIFHELYHISPAFDGDLRRFEGRYETHSASQKEYDAHMAKLVEQYLKNGADAKKYAFLRLSFWQLCRRHEVVVGDQIPRPKLIPI
jgi:predicted metallopeptidase